MKRSGDQIARWVGVLLPCAVIALRIPSLISNTELNVDESYFAVAALKYAQGGLPWRDVDTATSGPLNPLPLALILPWLPGLEYRAMHLCAALLVAATVWLTWKTLIRLTSPLTAVLASAVGMAWIAVAQARDHVHYSSEL